MFAWFKERRVPYYYWDRDHSDFLEWKGIEITLKITFLSAPTTIVAHLSESVMAITETIRAEKVRGVPSINLFNQSMTGI